MKDAVNSINPFKPLPEDLEALFKSISKSLYVLAAIQAAVMVFLLAVSKTAFGVAALANGLLDPAMYLIEGHFLATRRSRAVAVIILLHSLGSAVVTVQNRIAPELGSGGTNLWLVIIFVCMAIRSVQAAFAFHRQVKTQTRWRNVLVVSSIAGGYAVLSVLIVAVVSMMVGLSDETSGSAIIYAGGAVTVCAYAGFAPFTRDKPFGFSDEARTSLAPKALSP